MATQNDISVVFTQEEIDKVNQAFADIQFVISSKLFVLTKEQRDQYSSVGEGYENWINDCYNGMIEMPLSVPPFILLDEMKKDIDVRKVLNQWQRMASRVLEPIADANLVVGSDLKNNTLAYYNYIQAMEGHIPGIKPLLEKLSVFFKKTPKSTKPSIK
jgi:hypothetical protein